MVQFGRAKLDRSLVGAEFYSPHMRRKPITLKTAPCPECGTPGSLKKILWGMPSADFDFEKFAVGGCCIPENPPEIACSKCAWSGWRGSLIPSERIFRTDN